jgi:hypothetical protein
LIALLLALALVAITAVPALAIQDSEDHPVPFTPTKCRLLIERGAPFVLRGVGADEVCIIIIGGFPR